MDGPFLFLFMRSIATAVTPLTDSTGEEREMRRQLVLSRHTTRSGQTVVGLVTAQKMFLWAKSEPLSQETHET